MKSTVTEQDRRFFGARASSSIKHFRLGIYISGASVGVMDDFGTLRATDSGLQQVYEERNCFSYPYHRATQVGA